MCNDKKCAVLLAEGFEEGEAITIIDILRRAGITCDGLGLSSQIVIGGHGISVKADKIFDHSLLDYDLIVIPGGLPGATNLRDDDRLIHALQDAIESSKTVAAICAGSIVLERAGLLMNHQFTTYPGYESKLGADGYFKSDIVVIDRNIITSRGPATAYAFAFTLVKYLGFDAQTIEDRMLYDAAFPNREELNHA